MQRTVSTWDGFKQAWAGACNFLMVGECVPFARFIDDLPPLEVIVDELRQHPEATLRSGIKGDSLDIATDAQRLRTMPLHEAMQSSFSLAHYRLGDFDAPGRCLHGLRERVLEPWMNGLRANGFTWTRCYPIVFISGRDCATNYHMDFSHVLAWQVYGRKRFCGLTDPDRWAPHPLRMNYNPGPSFAKPWQITERDSLCYDMDPGACLWNALLTPHWVEAGDEVAMSLNLSHGGLRLHGQLAPFEQQLADWCIAHPELLRRLPQGAY